MFTIHLNHLGVILNSVTILTEFCIAIGTVIMCFDVSSTILQLIAVVHDGLHKVLELAPYKSTVAKYYGILRVQIYGLVKIV